ncbi:hypothetical protein Pelo_4225 [Pelomyxa schiedti]|nr:hypothetical protein Pelo_4225 [Pelomyxa schiedti]
MTVTGPASITTAVQSQIASLILAAHPRCGARTTLGPWCRLRAGLWVAFLRALWSDLVARSQLRLVLDVQLENDLRREGKDQRYVGVRVCVSPTMRALVRPVTTHKYCHGTRMDVDRHLLTNTGPDMLDLGVVDSTTYAVDVGCTRNSFRVHPNNYGVYDCNPRWVVVFGIQESGGDGTVVGGGVMIITKALDLAALKFEQRRVEMPFACCVKCVYFCVLDELDRAVVILTKPKPNEGLLFVLVVDVAMSFTSRSLVVVSETWCAVTDDTEKVFVSEVLSLTQSTGAHCFVIEKCSDRTQPGKLYMIRDGTPSLYAIYTKVTPDTRLSQLSSSQFCVHPYGPGRFAEIWDCGNDFRDSGAPWTVRVIRFSELGGYSMVGTLRANSGFLLVQLYDRVMVIEASTGVCWITVVFSEPHYITILHSVTRQAGVYSTNHHVNCQKHHSEESLFFHTPKRAAQDLVLLRL